MGAGLFTFVVWILVAVSLIPLFFFLSYPKDPKDWRVFLIPFLPLGITFAVLYMTHTQAIQEISFLYPSFDPLKLLFNAMAYLSSLFWGATNICYGPVWGGLINPVLGSFCFLGILDILRKPKSRLEIWFLGCLILFYLPGLVSHGLETFRIQFLFPLLLFTSLRGMALFLTDIHFFKIPLLGLLLVLGAFFDVYQLYGPYHQLWGVPGPVWPYVKSSVGFQAYRDLDHLHQQEGEGLVLSDLRPMGDKTLDLAVYSFDIAQNHHFQLDEARWAAVIVGNEYRPYLSKRFPTMVWYELGKEHPWDGVTWLLGVLRINSDNRTLLKSWTNLNEKLRSITDQILNVPPWQSQKSIVQSLEGLQNQIPQDPFLGSCYLERLIYYYAFVEKDEGETSQSVGKCLKYAYPMPHFTRYENEAR